jgi:hypothetical protein
MVSRPCWSCEMAMHGILGIYYEIENCGFEFTLNAVNRWQGGQRAMTNSFDIVEAMSKPLETTRGISSQKTHLQRHSVQSATQFNMNVNEVITNRRCHTRWALCRWQHDANWRSKF